MRRPRKVSVLETPSRPGQEDGQVDTSQHQAVHWRDLMPSLPMPSLPMPSVPLPSVPLPNILLPSVPLPSVPRMPHPANGAQHAVGLGDACGVARAIAFTVLLQVAEDGMARHVRVAPKQHHRRTGYGVSRGSRWWRDQCCNSALRDGERQVVSTRSGQGNTRCQAARAIVMKGDTSC